MFKAALALKRPSKKAAEATQAAPATRAAVAEAEGPPAQVPAPYAQFPQIPFGMPPVMGYGMPFGNPFMQWPAVPSMPPMTPCARRVSDDPPSSPVAPPCSVTDFCNQYELGAEAETGLEQLGFVMGDDLKSVTDAQYTQAGFKPLAWQRVLKAYKRYKRDNLL
jgi:hypothetical protein